MSCRQSSPPEAPSGQKSVLWCLPAFVPEKSFQALSSLLAPALGACEGGREERLLYPPWQQGKKLGLPLSLELHPWAVGEGLSRGRWRRFNTLSLQIMGFGGLAPVLLGSLRKEQLSVWSEQKGRAPTPPSQSCRHESSVLAPMDVSPFFPTSSSTHPHPTPASILKFSAWIHLSAVSMWCCSPPASSFVL